MSVIVVTGAARGMGRACVDRLRNEADHLVAVDLAAPDIEGTIGFACDVSDPAAVTRLVDEVRALGPFRSLVHAAGISPTMADARRVFEVDLVGTQLLLDAFEPLVVAGSSTVCFASSSAYQIMLLGPDAVLDALVEDPRAPDVVDRAAALFDDSGIAYAWAKRGVIRAAARAAVSWGRRGGRANSVSPGIIDTGMGRQEFDAQPMMQVMVDNTPVGRIGRAEEIAEVVLFLVSARSSYITGQTLVIDGGISLPQAGTDVALAQLLERFSGA
jgi:NAD(P)-dependent dehydrogenase (short-subunit alcohol dehydrogenase family)